MKPIKTLAMIYREVGTCGGIQRGASFQIGRFVEWGYEPVVLTEEDLGSGEGRQERLSEILRSKAVDLVIEHDAYDAVKLSADLSAARAAGIPFVVFWHSVFSWMVATGNAKNGEILGLLGNADALITLSETDAAFFRLLGCRAVAIPYCDADFMEGFERRGFPHRVVWLGRFVDLKRPLDAVRILELAKRRVKDLELVMLGDGSPSVRRKVEAYLAEHADLKGAVRLEGYRQDVRPYLESAGVGLVTSKFEGFCHSLVEMKMASLPVVSYSMPNLPTQDPGSGTAIVPQGDIAAAARAIVELFESPGKCASEGMLARKSYEALRSFDERTAYERLIAALGNPSSDYGREPVPHEQAEKVVAILLEHCQLGLSAAERRGTLAVRKGKAFKCGNALFSCLRAVGKLFRLGK